MERPSCCVANESLNATRRVPCRDARDEEAMPEKPGLPGAPSVTRGQGGKRLLADPGMFSRRVLLPVTHADRCCRLDNRIIPTTLTTTTTLSFSFSFSHFHSLDSYPHRPINCWTLLASKGIKFGYLCQTLALIDSKELDKRTLLSR